MPIYLDQYVSRSFICIFYNQHPLAVLSSSCYLPHLSGCLYLLLDRISLLDEQKSSNDRHPNDNWPLAAHKRNIPLLYGCFYASRSSAK